MPVLNQNNNNCQVCRVCSMYYLNPILLQCPHNDREEHVTKKLKENSNKIYKCDICSEEHEMPNKGC